MSHIQLSETGEIAMYVFAVVIVYSVWRWVHLARHFGKNTIAFGFYGLLWTLFCILLSLVSIVILSQLIFGRMTNLGKSQNDAMSAMAFLFMLVYNYGLRVFFWRKFTRESQIELDDIGKNQ